MCIIFIIISFLTQKAKCYADPYIMGGTIAKHHKFPHSVYIYINCVEPSICGGSILNQALVLTAGHCVKECSYKPNEAVAIGYGHENNKQMKTTRMKRYMVNENYTASRLENDLSLILTKDRITLNAHVKRVILMRSPPFSEHAYVAGWGLDEDGYNSILKYAKVKLHDPQTCEAYTHVIEGTFCAGPISGLGWAYRGDSGSGLIVNGMVQIGIVAYKVPFHSLNGYMNVSHYLDWITSASKKLYCYY